MKIHWRKLLFSLIFWFVAEICLTVIGLDDLADYSEFMLNKEIPVFVGLREFGNQGRLFRVSRTDNRFSFFKVTA